MYSLPIRRLILGFSSHKMEIAIIFHLYFSWSGSVTSFMPSVFTALETALSIGF